RVSQGYPNGIIPWDIDKCVKAAVALNRYFPGQGYDQDAVDMAEVIYNAMYTSPVIFDPEDTTEWWYTLGLTGGIDAFWSTGLHPVEYADLKAKLAAYQNPDGSWPSEEGYPVDTQSTAYAVVEAMRTGMNANGIDGAFWLNINQLGTGGWNSPENNEISGESIDALYAAHGVSLVDLQFQPVVLCNEVPMSIELQDTCDGFGAVNTLTDKKFHCLYTVEPFRLGETELAIFARNVAGAEFPAFHREGWFFNPAISMMVETSDGMPVHFEDMPYGADTAPERTVHSLNKIKVKNTAEGGVNLWMYIAGTDFSSSSGAAFCPDSNRLAVENMAYRAWSGTQWQSWEGWTQMPEYDQNQGCSVSDTIDCGIYGYERQTYQCDRYVETTGSCGGDSPCYTTIQPAINAASNNEVICIYDGTYAGATANKPVTLYSINTHGTTINCGGSGNGVLLQSGGITIDGLLITNCQVGVRSYGGPSTYDDISILGTRITGNVQNGILVVHDTINGLTIENSEVVGTTGGNGIGISNSATVSDLTIRGTEVSGSRDHNIYINGATLNDPLVEHSEIKSATNWEGIHIEGSNIDGLDVVCSQISDNGGFGFATKTSTTENTVFDRVTVSGNGNSGVGLFGTVNGVIVTHSTFEGNVWEDIDIGTGWVGATDASNIRIEKSNFNGGAGIGVWIDSTSGVSSSDVVISQNNILNGVNNQAGTYVNAENNWWGCSAGPGNVGCSAATNVDFDPWLHARRPVISSCYGGKPLPSSENPQNPLEHVLTNQGTLEMEFKLQYPNPCQGNFDQGNIYIFGKAI
ncbi:MAG: right-handed parallel beta-helix repeat-containing protein, partial [Candidatus Aenigmatarchaeota archaeon]